MKSASTVHKAALQIKWKEKERESGWLALHKGYQFFEKDPKIKILTAREPVLPSFKISKTASTAIQSTSYNLTKKWIPKGKKLTPHGDNPDTLHTKSIHHISSAIFCNFRFLRQLILKVANFIKKKRLYAIIEKNPSS